MRSSLLDPPGGGSAIEGLVRDFALALSFTSYSATGHSLSRQQISAVVTVVLIVVADLLTKSWALQDLAGGRQIEWLGGLVPLTLAFNRGAAFGLTIGDDPRWIFIPITLVAIIFLTFLIIGAGPQDRLRTFASALVMGGALGNLYDRVRWDRGVVDFIGPIDLGFMLWPIFNIADMAITTGAILLAIALWREDARARGEQPSSVTGSEEA